VTARTTADIRADGKTIIPKGTKLVGHVTEAAARAKGGSDSSLGIAFDKAVLKGGEELPLNVAIVAVAPPPASMPGQQNKSNGAPGAPVASPGAPSNMGRPGGTGSMGGSPATSSAPTGPPVDTTVASNGAPAEKGLDALGRLTSDSRGVYGLKDASLRPATNPAEGSVITSNGKTVRLDSDTQLLLVTQGRGAATAAPKS